MAKISTMAAIFAGKRVEANVEYSTKTGSFFVRIPEELFINNLIPGIQQVRVTGRNYKCIAGKSEGEATTLFKKYAEAWNQTSKKERKVILLEFDYGYNREERNWRSDHKKISEKNRSSIFDSESDLEIKLNMRIATERTIGKEIIYFSLDKSNPGEEILDNHGGEREEWANGWTIIAWTQEREDFCRKLYNAYGDLIDLMIENFKDEKKFKELVTGKLKLLN